jgi:Tfp pilus assembly protein PilN
MSLKINLYHEVLRARHDEQYDPLRLSMIGLIVIVACLAGYYVIALAGKSSVENAYRAKQQEYADLQPKVKAAEAQEEELNKHLGLADKLQQRIEDRFYWGPVFEQLVTVVPPNVQITRCSGDIAPDGGRRCQITVEGLAAGEEPRRVAEDLRVRLLEKLGATYKNATAVFRNLEDGTEKVMLDGNRLATANFNIGINFVPKSTPEPTPAPRKVTRRIAKNEQE